VNRVSLIVTITRANARQCSLELFRGGVGDDMVEQRADELETAIKEAGEKIIASNGGILLKTTGGTQPDQG